MEKTWFLKVKGSITQLLWTITTT